MPFPGTLSAMPWWVWVYVIAFTLFSCLSVWDDVRDRRVLIMCRSLMLFGSGLAGTLAYWLATPSPPNARWLAMLLIVSMALLAWDLSEAEGDDARQTRGKPAGDAAADDDTNDDADDDGGTSGWTLAAVAVAVFLPSYIWGALFVLAAYRAQR
jgi:hypothetical protein